MATKSYPDYLNGPGRVESAIAATAAAAGANSATIDCPGRGLVVVVDITAITGTTPSLTVTVQGYDRISGKYYTLLASAALAAVATTVLKVYPDLTAAANLVANDVAPAAIRISTAVAGTTPAVTYTVSVHHVP